MCIVAFWLTQETLARGIHRNTAKLEAVEREIHDARNEIATIIRRINALPEDAQTRLRLASLRARIDTIEAALVDSPEKAMSIPILRKDLEALASESRSDIRGLSTEIERIYIAGAWFVSVVAIPIALAVLGMGRRSKE
jgi:BMFP domain-containing protein YqiC